MRESIRLQPIKAAHQFVNKHFPDCQGALLAGSVIRGQATATSDLDIVIFDTTISSPYRESLTDFGWAVIRWLFSREKLILGKGNRRHY